MRWQAKNLTSIAAVALFLGLGCAGELVTAPGNGEGGDDTDDGGDDGGGSGGANARELYDALNQQQLIECGACHAGANLDDTATGPDYLGLDAQASYDTIMAYRSYQDGSPIVGDSPENSKLYFYGAHAGPAFSEGLAELVAEWIEVQAGGGGGGDGGDDPPDDGADPPPATGPGTLVEGLTQFANCMQYADFQAAGFADVAAQQTAEGQCYGCHAAGTGGAFLSQDSVAFYDNQRRMPYILKFVTGTVNEQGAFEDLVLSGRYEQKQADNGHPNYLMDAARVAAIQTFYDATRTRYTQALESGTPCTPDMPVPVPPQ